MYKHILHLPDGSVLSSGVSGQAAIRQVTLTECVNTTQELEPGCVCATLLEAEILFPGEFKLEAGQTVTLQRQEPDGTIYPAGVFILEKPQRSGAHLYRLTAYDRVSLLDKDLTDWLAALDGWPYTLQQLAAMVCAACGTELTPGEIPNGDFTVQKFTGSGITGRRLMQWIAQASGRFCRANAQGALELSWYRPVPLKLVNPNVGPGMEVTAHREDLSLCGAGIQTAGEDAGLCISSRYLAAIYEEPSDLELCLKRVLPYYSGSLDAADYSVQPVERVRLCQNREDVGTVYPETAGQRNTCTIQGNPLLQAAYADSLKAVARTLYQILSQVSYRPCTVRLPADPTLEAGQIITVAMADGTLEPMYVMQCKRNGQTDQLECTGSYSRESSTAVNQQGFVELGGKVLELKTDVDGLRLENRDAQRRLSRIEADVTGVRTRVEDWEDPGSSMQKRVSSLEQSAHDLQIRMERVDAGQAQGATHVTTATGFTFDENGLRIAKEGQQMENLLDNDGMCVKRSGETVLQADSNGVVAVDVQVNHYLCIGTHARLEDYTHDTDQKRTACFHVG